MALQTTHAHFAPVGSLHSNSLPCPADLHGNFRTGLTGNPLQLATSRLPRSKQNSRYHCCASFENGDDDDKSHANSLHSPYGFFLHDLMDQAGIDTSHARTARKSFVKEVRGLSSGGSSVSIRDCQCLDLARAALEVSAEDDALVSHSPVALPVDSYIERLNSMAIEFAGHHMPTQNCTPEAVLCSLDNYLYGYKGFQIMSSSQLGDARGCYLNMVLTRRLGTSVMLALIYSEIVKILKSWGVIDFTVDMELPADHNSLPHPVLVSDSSVRTIGEEGTPILLTPKNLLADIVATLKRVYWPWKLLNGSVEGSDFLKAADAANRGMHTGSGAPVESLFTAPNNIIGAEIASARAAKHRLQRGIWTSTSFGDMRRALAASERLVVLGIDKKELRDYGILLYHCGLYEPSFTYLSEYHLSKQVDSENASSSAEKSKDMLALENVLLRLRLILAEKNWNAPTTGSFLGESLTDPW